MKTTLVLFCLLLAGCASTPTPVPAGDANPGIFKPRQPPVYVPPYYVSP